MSLTSFSRSSVFQLKRRAVVASQMLDFLTSTTFAAAYSTRLIRGGYTGYAMKVRRSSDNSTLDIGFSNGLLNESALTSFVGSGNGYVAVWYDQSGNGNDLVQTNNAAQPLIVSSGSIVKFSNRPMISTDGISQHLLVPSATLPTYISSSVVGNFSQSNKMFIEHSVNSNTNDGFYFSGDFNNSWSFRRAGVDHQARGVPGWLRSYKKIEDTISDMSSSSEIIAKDAQFGWQYNPFVVTTAPRGDAIASWWTGERPTWLYAVLSWFTLFEAQGNTSTNTRVELKNMRVYWLSNATRTWTRWDIQQNWAATYSVGDWYYPFNGGSPLTDKRAESDGGTSFRPVDPHFVHGYGNAQSIANPADVRAVFSALDFRLVVANTSLPDDRANARYVVSSGADYYPDMNLHWSLGYAPGIATGRQMLVTNYYRTASMLVPNNFSMNCSMAEIQGNPPPMYADTSAPPEPQSAVLTYDGTGTYYRNGTSQSNNTVVNSALSNSNLTAPLYVGSRGGSSSFTNGKWGELILANGKMSSGDLSTLKQNQNSYWNFP